ncbi:MAG: MGH1-like glycoside hydrolase domain-containing protein [Candidatus Helarchaeota archaeon]
MPNSTQNEIDKVQLLWIIIILGFGFSFYFITPFRLFFYWKIPLLEDNITTLIWIVPLFVFFPLFQFFRDTNPKRLIQIFLFFLPLLFIGEIFANSYTGIFLIFEGFLITMLLIYGLKCLAPFFQFYTTRVLGGSFLIAGTGALCLFVDSLIYQLFYVILALIIFVFSFSLPFNLPTTSEVVSKHDSWTKKSYFMLWIFIVLTIAILMYMIIGIARMNLMVFPMMLAEFQIYLISMIILLFTAALSTIIVGILAKRVNRKLSILLGLTLLAFCYLIFSFFPTLVVFYIIIVMGGFGTSLFFHNLLTLLFKVSKEYRNSFLLCFAVSLYFDQLLMTLLTLHGGTDIFTIGLISFVEFIALIGVISIIFSGASFVKKKVNLKFVLNQFCKIISILLLAGIFIIAYTSSIFLNISEEPYQVTNSPPTLFIEDTNLQVMVSQLYKELESNLRIIPETGHLFAMPGGYFYKKPCLWDTAYIAQIWKYYNVTIAETLLRNYIHQIYPNGLIPNQYHPLGIYDALTQCPILAWASLEIYEISQNRQFLEEVFPLLKQYNQWWLTTRDFNGNGLYSWIHRDETGLDDCPRFDLYPIYTIDAIDLNCYLVLQMRTLARIAQILNNSEDAINYAIQAQQLTTRIQTHLWDNTTGFFYDRVGDSFISLKTSSQFLPLFTEVATPEQATRLLAHLNDPAEFNITYPIPSVARNEVVFSNIMWRGPTWINLNYLIVRGLISYNFTTEASKIAYKTIKMAESVFNETGTFWEFYNSESGRVDDVVGKTGWTPASNFTGWDGLLANLLIENLIGLTFNGSSIHFYPLLPPQWNGSQIRLQLNNFWINLTLSNSLLSSAIHFNNPTFHNVTILDERTYNETTFYTPDVQINFTNFNPYLFTIK